LDDSHSHNFQRINDEIIDHKIQIVNLLKIPYLLDLLICIQHKWPKPGKTEAVCVFVLQGSFSVRRKAIFALSRVDFDAIFRWLARDESAHATIADNNRKKFCGFLRFNKLQDERTSLASRAPFIY
jgi:hypothetical protein